MAKYDIVDGIDIRVEDLPEEQFVEISWGDHTVWTLVPYGDKLEARLNDAKQAMAARIKDRLELE
jgi:hypothetical protein